MSFNKDLKCEVKDKIYAFLIMEIYAHSGQSYSFFVKIGTCQHESYIHYRKKNEPIVGSLHFSTHAFLDVKVYTVFIIFLPNNALLLLR